MTYKKILIIAGEPSGDLHGSNLVKNLKKLMPEYAFYGMGGKLMKNAGVNILYDTDIAIIGVSEIVKHLFDIKKIFTGLCRKLKEEKFDLVILIDFPGFNLRFAKEVKKRNIPLIYYISPQVWAWGKYRIRTIKKTVDKILVFFEFEEKMYKKLGIDSEFVGHPLLGTVKSTVPKDEWLKKNNLSLDKLTISLLPGSRKKVIEQLLPIMLKSAELIKLELPNTQFMILKFPDVNCGIYDQFIKNCTLDVKIIEGDLYNALNAADFSIGASGTSSLETAIMGVPMVITYKFSNLSYILIKLAVRVSFIGIPNIIAGKLILKEFVQWDAKPKKISEEVVSTLKDPQKILSIKNELQKVKLSLGIPGASERAARTIYNFLLTK